MAHISELTNDLQTALDKAVAGPIQVELILDPDGLNLDLSGYIDQKSSLVISKSKAIRPYGSLGAFTIGEVRVKLINRGNYFNSFDPTSPFYHFATRLYNDKADSGTTIRIPSGDGDTLSGKAITISDALGSYTYTVDSVSTSDPNFDELTLNESGSRAFVAGDLVETQYLPGKKVTIKTTVDGVTDKIAQYSGVLANLPRLLDKNLAEITLVDNFKRLLDRDLRANSVFRLKDSLGSKEASITYSRSGESTGTIVPELIIIIASACKIGKWEIEILNAAEDFILTDPDGATTESNTGNGLTEIYSDGKLMMQLVSLVFAGSFDAGDKITFETFCSLGNGINDHHTIPKMLKNLLTENFAGNRPASELGISFDDLITDYDEMRAAISFSQRTSVLKAIELLQAHINASVYHTNDGLFEVAAYRPRLQQSLPPALSPDADVQLVEIESLEPIKLVVGNYDHQGSNYQSRVVFPRNTQNLGDQLDVNFPAFHSADHGQANSSTGRIFAMWRRGLVDVHIREKFQYGLGWDINDVFQVSSIYPTLPAKNVEVYSIRKDLIKGSVEADAYDVDFVFGRYGFTDQHHTDQGYVVW